MSSEETKRPLQNHDFRGAWAPTLDPLIAGGKSFALLQNLSPCGNGLEGIPGYSAITNQPISATYTRVHSGIQLRQLAGTHSRVFLSASDPANQTSAIVEQVALTAPTDVPNALNFNPSPVYVDPTQGPGRFSTWPNNQIAYCNGSASLVYGGDEMYPAAVLTAAAVSGITLIDACDVTRSLTNNLQTTGNVARVCSAVTDTDSNTKLQIFFDGYHGSTSFADNSFTGGGRAPHTITPYGNANLDTTAPALGTAAGHFPDSASYLSISRAGSLDLPADVGVSGATIDFRVKFFQANALAGVCGQCRDIDHYWYLACYPHATDSYWRLQTKKGEFEWWYDWHCGEITPQTWSHVALQITSLSLPPMTQQAVLHINGMPYGQVTINSAVASIFMNDDIALLIGRAQHPHQIDPPPGVEHPDGVRHLCGSLDVFRISSVMRWPSAMSSPFTPPVIDYGRPANKLVVKTTRPIRALKFYCKTLNDIPHTLALQTWTGQQMETLPVSDGTAGLSVDAASLVITQGYYNVRPLLIQGQYFYTYVVSMASGTAQIYKLTVDAPFQRILDLWDGVSRPVIEFRIRKDGQWTDKTMAVVETAAGVTDAAAYIAQAGALAAADCIDLAVSERATAFRITMYEQAAGKVNTAAVTMAVLFWDGAGYRPAQGLNDGTSLAGATLAASGNVFFAAPEIEEEYQKTERDATLWRYRLIFSGALSADVWIDRVVAIPAPQLPNNLGYVFPFMFQNRAMLCNLATTGEGNRVDYALANSTEGWNGEDSSLGDGKSPLYIGSADPLTAACEIYNRLSSSIYTFALFFKSHAVHILNGYDSDTYRDYPLSDKIGCPAPLTLDTYQIFTSREQQSSRAIACWLSYAGPYVFDAGGLAPLPGIECYFDQTDPRCINYAAIDVACGWFDPDLPQYNLQIPSGPAATENNVWLVHDFRENRWYPKVPQVFPAPYLSAVLRVADATGKRYMYGARTNGYLMRLGHSTTWDGGAIEQLAETAEILPSGNLWDIAKMVRFKLFFKPLSEPATLTVTMYRDGGTTGTVIATIPLQGTERLVRFSKKLATDALSTFRLRFTTETSASAKGLQLLAWSFKYSIERQDDQ